MKTNDMNRTHDGENDISVTGHHGGRASRRRPGVRWAATAGSTVALLATGVLAAEPAHADATGCHTQNEVGDISVTCIHVGGTGLHVDTIRASIQFIGVPDPEGNQPCVWNATAYGTLSNGRPYSAKASIQCEKINPPPTEADFSPNSDFAADTQVCIVGNIYSRTEGPVCETIHA